MDSRLLASTRFRQHEAPRHPCHRRGHAGPSDPRIRFLNLF
jgi:hypothetical protein